MSAVSGLNNSTSVVAIKPLAGGVSPKKAVGIIYLDNNEFVPFAGNNVAKACQTSAQFVLKDLRGNIHQLTPSKHVLSKEETDSIIFRREQALEATKKLAALTAKETTLTSDIAKSDLKIQALSAKEAEHLQNMAKLSSKKDELKATKSALTAKKDELKATKSALTAKEEELKNNIARRNARLEEIRARREAGLFH